MPCTAISLPPFPRFLSECCGLQLEAEGGTEDGEQHGGVAAEDRAAVDGQSRSIQGYARGETCL
jgi:hypothetical protein